jgi:hypothetical protein
MAKRRTYTRTVYRSAKRSYRSRGGAGAFKPVIAGALAGAAGGLASSFLGNYGNLAAHIGVGWFMKNQTLMTIGGMELGQMFFGGGNNVTKSGFWES